MALIQYTQDVAWQGFRTWLMGQGLQYCQQPTPPPPTPTPTPSLAAGSYAQAGSQIRYSVLTTLTSATVNFYGQFQPAAGGWQNVGQTVVGTSSGGIDQVTLPATAGWYGNMVATVGSATVSGNEVYVLVELGRTDGGAFAPYAVLLSGYVVTNQPLDSGAGSQVQNGTNVSRKVVSVSDPAAGAQFFYTIPTGERWRPIAVHYNFVTSAAAGSREAGLVVDDGTSTGFSDDAGVYLCVIGGFNHGANSQLFYHFIRGVQHYTGTQQNNSPQPLGDLFLVGGDRIRSHIFNISALDQVSSIRILTEVLPS